MYETRGYVVPAGLLSNKLTLRPRNHDAYSYVTHNSCPEFTPQTECAVATAGGGPAAADEDGSSVTSPGSPVEALERIRIEKASSGKAAEMTAAWEKQMGAMKETPYLDQFGDYRDAQTNIHHPTNVSMATVHTTQLGSSSW